MPQREPSHLQPPASPRSSSCELSGIGRIRSTPTGGVQEMSDDAKDAKKQAEYRERVKKGLDRAYTEPQLTRRTFDLDADRLVIFSDHHRGTRDGADDFWRCERAYRAALGYYLESGHHLYLLGDVEELWENAPAGPIADYADTLALEGEFLAAG